MRAIFSTIRLTSFSLTFFLPRPPPIPVHYSLHSLLLDSRLDPVTLPLTNSQHQRCLPHR